MISAGAGFRSFRAIAFGPQSPCLDPRGSGYFWWNRDSCRVSPQGRCRLFELTSPDGARVAYGRGNDLCCAAIEQLAPQFPKTSFPTAAVFGATVGPTLRLITCTGAFDQTARSYLDNLVAFASPARS